MDEIDNLVLLQDIKKYGCVSECDGIKKWCAENHVYRLVCSGYVIGSNEYSEPLTFPELYHRFNKDKENEKDIEY